MATVYSTLKPGEMLPPEEIARLQALSKKLEALDDSEIDLSDIPGITPEDLKDPTKYRRISDERRDHA